MLAHFEEPEPNGDRRRSPRRAMKLGLGENSDSVTIHDLSLTGALIETSVPMLVGALLEIDLPITGKVELEVVWNSGEYYGCQFSLPIAPSALSAALLQAEPRANDTVPDPLGELRELSAEVERLAWKLDSALRKLTKN